MNISGKTSQSSCKNCLMLDE